MPMGWCKDCVKLVHIVPGEFYPESRQRRWYPIQHDAPTRHVGDGTRRTRCAAEYEGRGGIVFAIDGGLRCDYCEHEVDHSEVKVSGPCNGHKRECK